ncbi:MAG: sensor histidine kinase [Candidatus Dormibacteria bacterium]
MAGTRAHKSAARTGKRWRPGLAVRLAALHAGILTVVLVAVGLQVDRVVAGNLLGSVNTGLVEELAEYGNAAAHRSSSTPLANFDQTYLHTHQLPSGHAILLAVARSAAPPRGAILGSSGSTPIRTSALVTDWLDRIPNHSVFGEITAAGVSYRVLISPVLSSGRVVGAFIASADLTGMSQAVASQLEVVIVEGAVALIAAVMTAYFLLRRVLRVVDGVTTTAEEISESDLTRRLAYQGPDDEVGRLARTFDHMLERLASSFAGQRRLLADVSHQLRTPLTVIRGHLELLLRDGTTDAEEVAGTLAVVLDELDGTALLVDRLLLLGRALEPEFLEEEPIELGPFLADILDAGDVMGDRHWVLRPVPPLELFGDRAKLRGALLNLVDNAVKATKPGDTIAIEALISEQCLTLKVSDTGVGIEPEIRSVVFDRFVAGKAGGPRGTGLGLAIVRAVIEAHGGTVELTSAPGQGCTVQITLPASRLVPPGHKASP